MILEESMRMSDIPEGYKQTKVGVIPEEWKVVKFSQICKQALNGGTPSTKIQEYWEGSIPWITGADVVEQRIRDVRRYITIEAVESSATHVVPKGMLLLVTRTGVGKVAVAPFDIAISQDLTGIIPTDNASVEYLFWTFNRANRHFLNMNQGTSINGIKRNDLMNFALPLPPLPEQHRIATILSTVDAAIAATDEVIAKTEDLKGGLMQDLLTKGIDEEGRVRSEETHEFCEKQGMRVPEEWEVMKFSKILLKSPETGLWKSSEYFGGGYKIVRMTEFFKDDILNPNCSESIRLSGKELEKYRLNSMDLLFGRRSLKVDGAGRCVLVPELDEPIIYESSLIRVTLNRQRADPLYYLYYLNSIGRRQISKIIRTVAVSGITGKDLQNILVSLPPLPEQHRIAAVLSTVDRNLAAEHDHRARLQTIKQGLMQDLLTGRKRVPFNGGEVHGA